ncbi:hypothetical protein Rcae01_06435 [Novipirellula caenicola]|uniref:Uncharacterized protein n=1 Tax=Novipirellula caenicola TaxID=1536901 RepID=A0ABP9W4R6_9BACT
MRYRLSTLLLTTTCIALAIGWSVDRYTHRVPSYEDRLADHARLAATLAKVNQLHQFCDSPQPYLRNVPDLLFGEYLQLFRNRRLFERTYGPIGDASRIDAAALRWIGYETLRRIEVTTLNEFEEKLRQSGLGGPQVYDLYTANGSLKPGLSEFVLECLAATTDPALTHSSGPFEGDCSNAMRHLFHSLQNTTFDHAAGG